MILAIWYLTDYEEMLVGRGLAPAEYLRQTNTIFDARTKRKRKSEL